MSEALLKSYLFIWSSFSSLSVSVSFVSRTSHKFSTIRFVIRFFNACFYILGTIRYSW